MLFKKMGNDYSERFKENTVFFYDYLVESKKTSLFKKGLDL
jgi:hypothetical protein|tara:strand:+ start:385 stop:507 length:123 start_codon:yes stop_codon:yes gene_type:complete